MELFERMKEVKAFIFDVDGVLTDGRVLVTEDGLQLRTFDIKDGFALRALVEAGKPIAVISGGNSQGVQKRLSYLGIENVFLGISDKQSIVEKCLQMWNLTFKDLLFMGDDIPDLNVMEQVGFPCCPQDACEEVKAASVFISSKPGGRGAARDIIEKILKLQKQWPTQIRTANG